MKVVPWKQRRIGFFAWSVTCPAFDEMAQQASDLGANAIVGIDVDYETVGANGGMLMVAVSGTAVTVR